MYKLGRLPAEESKQRKIEADKEFTDLINIVEVLNDCGENLQKQLVAINSKIKFNKCGWSKKRLKALKAATTQIELIKALALGYPIKNKRVRRIILLLALGKFTVGGQAHLTEIEKEHQDLFKLWNQKN